MSGGSTMVTIEVCKVSEILDSVLLSAIPDSEGIRDSLAGLVISIAENVVVRSGSEGSTFSPTMDECLRRYWVAPGVSNPDGFNDFAAVFHAVEGFLLSRTLDERVEAVNILSGSKQVAKNVILFKFKDAFGLVTADHANPMAFLLSFGMEEQDASDLVRDPEFRDIMKEVYLLVFWVVLVTLYDPFRHGAVHSELYDLGHPTTDGVLTPVPPAVLPVPRELVAEGPLQLPARSARTRAQAVPVVSPMPTASSATEYVTASHFAEFQRQVLAALARQAPPAPPAPGVPLPVPRRADPRRAVAEPEDADPFSEEESELDEEDLSSMVVEERDRAYLAAGTAMLRGGVRPHTGESAHFMSSINPLVAPTADYFEYPRLGDALHRARANYGLHTEMTFDEMIHLCSSADGLFVLSINGIPCVYHIPHTSKPSTFVPKVVTKLFNPDAHSYLARLGAYDVAAHLVPVTVDQFEVNMNDQQLKSMHASPLFPNTKPDVLIKALFAYKRKVYTLLDGIFGGHSTTVVQAHRHHVTIWSQVLLFHINRWMRAMVHGDIALLLTGFDTTWQTTYLVQLGLDSRGYPLVQLLDALQFLSYRCPQCNRLSGCALFCSYDACRAAIAAASATPAANDTSTGYMSAFKAFMKTQKTGTKEDEAAHKLFLASPTAKELGFHSRPAKPTARKSTVSLSCQDRANEQSSIRLHVCPNFQYA